LLAVHIFTSLRWQQRSSIGSGSRRTFHFFKKMFKGSRLRFSFL